MSINGQELNDMSASDMFGALAQWSGGTMTTTRRHLVSPNGTLLPQEAPQIQAQEEQRPQQPAAAPPPASAPVDTGETDVQRAWRENRLRVVPDKTGEMRFMIVDDPSHIVDQHGAVFDAQGHKIKDAPHARNEAVDTIQKLIAPNSKNDNLTDGVWGGVTAKALEDKLKEIQKKHGLDETGHFDKDDKKMRQAISAEFGEKDGEKFLKAMDTLRDEGKLDHKPHHEHHEHKGGSINMAKLHDDGHKPPPQRLNKPNHGPGH